MSVRTAVLSDICDINPRAPKSISDDEVVSFLPMSAVSEGGFVEYEEKRQFAAVKKGYTYFERGDVLVAKITPCFENGKATGTTNLKHEIGFGSTEFHVLRPSPELDRGYLFYLLWNERFRQSAVKGMTGSAGQKRVPADLLKRLEIPLPPLDEQRRIAAILDKADSLRQKRKQAIALLDSLTQSIFLEMFGEPDPTWPVIELKEAVKTGTIVTYGIVQAGDEFDGGVPYIRTGDLRDGIINEVGLRHTDPEIASRFSRSRVEAGEIVMSIRATVGTTAVVPESLHGANLTQGTARISPGEQVTPEYLLHYLRSDAVQYWIQRQVKGATFREITLKRLRELEVLIPPMSVQAEFARMVQALKLNASKSHLSSSDLENLFASLQHRAFAGEL